MNAIERLRSQIDGWVPGVVEAHRDRAFADLAAVDALYQAATTVVTGEVGEEAHACVDFASFAALAAAVRRIEGTPREGCRTCNYGERPCVGDYSCGAA